MNDPHSTQRVFVTQQVPGRGVQMFREAGLDVRLNPADGPCPRRTLLSEAVGCGGLFTQLNDKVDAEVFDAAGPSLRVVSNYAVGFNNIDVAEATRRGIVVCNTPGVLTEATADIAWSLLMAVTRRVVEGDRLVRRGAWTGWKPAELLGGDLAGKTLAIVGAGRIGQAVARRSRGWGMKVLYVARRRDELFEAEFAAPLTALDAALEAADVVSLHVPLTPETHHLIDARRLARMKPTAYLINTARGAVIDEAALVEALRDRRIAGAGLDVYENEPALAEGLADLDNVVLLPHLGSATVGTRSAMSDLAAENLLAVLHGRRPPCPVNPEVNAAWD